LIAVSYKDIQDFEQVSKRTPIYWLTVRGSKADGIFRRPRPEVAPLAEFLEIRMTSASSFATEVHLHGNLEQFGADGLDRKRNSRTGFLRGMERGCGHST